jgi:hypothetical protein
MHLQVFPVYAINYRLSIIFSRFYRKFIKEGRNLVAAGGLGSPFGGAGKNRLFLADF